MKFKVLIETKVDIQHIEMSILDRYSNVIPKQSALRLSDSRYRLLINIETGEIFEWDCSGIKELLIDVNDVEYYGLIDDYGNLPFEIPGPGYLPSHILPTKDGKIHLVIDEYGVVTNWLDKISIEDFI